MPEISLEQLAVAELVREACIEASRAAFADAGQSGLCEEGAWEAAIGAMQTLDLEQLLLRPAHLME